MISEYASKFAALVELFTVSPQQNDRETEPIAKAA